MTTLTINRWQTRYLADDLVTPEELRAWDEAPRRIRMPSIADTDAIICVRRLDIHTTIRQGDGSARVGELLEQALETRLAELIGSAPSGSVVIWRDRRDALADMLYRACCGDVSRVWAWRQIGLLGSGANGPREIREAAIATLAAEPALIWPVLARLIQAETETGALTALMTRMTLPDWTELMPWIGLVAELHGDVPDGLLGESATGPTVAALLDWAAERPFVALRHRTPLIALLTLASSPALAGGGSPVPVLRTMALATMLDRVIGTEAPASRSDECQLAPHSSVERPRVDQSNIDLNPDAPSDNDIDDDAPPAPDLPEAAGPLFSTWAGLLFLIPLLPEVGFVERAGEEPEVLARALTDLALAIGAPEDDPAIRALRGNAEPSADAAPPEGLIPETITALEALLINRLGPMDEAESHSLGVPANPPAPHTVICGTSEDESQGGAPPSSGWLPIICRRSGVISIEPGWIEVEFPLDAADTRLRRGAIDLDPGFVPWLGCTVRYRYV